MKYIGIVSFGLLACSSASYANCVPPMQTLFACNFEDSDARVEFCHEILREARTEGSNSYSSEPGDAKSYSLARGTAPTELYFTPTDHYFYYTEATAIDKKVYGNGIANFLVTGYENVDYVYAALIGVDEAYGGVYGAEVRVFRNEEDFRKMQTGSEVGRYFCRADSVIVNDSEFRP